ncbi:MAG: hypothetical protein ABFC96_13375 [Thermoguttaceae bacterium]
MFDRRFRILTPDGRLSSDRFFVASEQPHVVPTGCLLVVHERTGRAVTVPETQLFPAEAIREAPLSGNATRACLSRGQSEETAGQAVAVGSGAAENAFDVQFTGVGV